ncbi:hypothetical protein AB205_0218860 [Aquarana catesbeiana]|uniref:Uncharacterized protein n=1 Tax=Aquarana catesbeiana TaxID=8400 RepID=A0A2G9S1I8_AQUCT|nr:hypothetical protein AB205_0218860 [Aquarana catesbeiana]
MPINEYLFTHDEVSSKCFIDQKTSICYLSFPDSYSGCLGDTQFTFRMRRSAGQRSLFQDDEKYNREAPVTLQVSSNTDSVQYTIETLK